jgi:signal peptidase II
MGNGLDRLAHGHVVDFLDFVFAGWHYWTFNLADSFIISGAILWGLHSIRTRAPGDVPAQP